MEGVIAAFSRSSLEDLNNQVEGSENTSIMEDLPIDMKLEIFSRLPVEVLYNCGQGGDVEWETLLRRPYFIKMCLSNVLPFDKTGGYLYLKDNSAHESNEQLCYEEYDLNEGKCIKTVTNIYHPPIWRHDMLIGSCNGLICLAMSGVFELREIVCIFNPLSRERVDLPKGDLNFKSLTASHLIFPMLYGFGFVSSTSQYKVIRILFRHLVDDWVGSVQVYTLGSDKDWRNKDDIENLLPLKCTYANGAIHWLKGEDRTITAFDLEEEKFLMLPNPPCFSTGPGNFFELKVLGKKLCVVHKCQHTMSVWSFNDTSSSPTKKKNYLLWCWHKEFTMVFEGKVEAHEYELFALTKSGKVLMWYKPYNIHAWVVRSFMQKNYILCRYDPKTAKLEKLDGKIQYMNNVIPHLNTLVSLKALGETTAVIE